jgi:hypothetical protein
MKKTLLSFLATLACLLFASSLRSQTSVDINGDGTLNILVIGTSISIEDNFEEFSPNQITSELQSILLADTSISINVNVGAENIYKTKITIAILWLNITIGLINIVLEWIT